jgi:hypothetical protein
MTVAGAGRREAAGEDPVAIGPELLIEDIDRGHLLRHAHSTDPKVEHVLATLTATGGATATAVAQSVGSVRLVTRRAINPKVDEGPEAAARLPSDCSGQDAIESNVDGEAEPLVAIAGDHLGGVGGEKRKPVRR